jgi:hypothetical protein
MNPLRRIGIVLSYAGGITFIAVLYLSAYFEPDIRWLHFFQSWMYIAALVLMSRRNKWGCFIGATAAFFWDYVNVFVTTFFRNGIDQLRILSSTGHVPRPESLISVPAWLGNLALILGALLVYLALPRKQWSDAGRILIAFVGTSAFFAGAMALVQPRYLPYFRAALHPHWML